MSDEFRNQFRSWQIMEMYFGIKQMGSVYVSVNWPPHIQDCFKKLEPLIKRANDLWEEKAKLN
jgi:hypothetical protein